MKKQNLFEQMNRIKTLMKVNVLSEQNVKPIEKAAEELWNTTKRLFVKGTERTAEESVENAIKKIETFVDRESKQYLENLSRSISQKGVQTVEKELVEFLSKSKEIQKQIINNLEINFQKEVNDLLVKTATSPEIRQTFDELYSQALRYAGGDIEQAQNTLRQILSDELSDTRLLEKYFDNVVAVEDDLGNWVIKTKETDVVNPFDPNTEATENSAGNGPGIDSEEVIENVTELSKKPGTFKQIIQSLIRSMNLRDLQTVLTGWRNGFKGIDKLAKEFELYGERMKSNIQNGLRYDAEIAKMEDILISAKRSWGELPERTWKEWVNNLPKEVKDIINGYGATGAKWKVFWTELNKQEEWLTPVMNEGRAFAKLNPFRIPGAKTNGWFIFKAPSPELGKRLGNLILFKDPRTFAEMRQSLIQNGVRQDLVRTIMSKVIMDTILGPIILATAGQFVRPVVAGAEGLYNAIRDTDANFINYNEPNEEGVRESNVLTIIRNDWNQVFESLIPSDILEAVKSVLDPTYVDEFFTNVIGPVVTAQKAIEESNLRDKVRDFGNKKTEEFQQWYNGLTKSAKETVDEYTKKIKDFEKVEASKAGDNETWFTAWCLKNGKNKKEWISSTDGKYGVTTDGIKWKYNEQTKGFDEIKQENNNTNVYSNDPESFKKFCSDKGLIYSSGPDEYGVYYTTDGKSWVYNFKDCPNSFCEY